MLYSLPGGVDHNDRNREDFRRLAMQLHYDLPRDDSPRSALLVTPGSSELTAAAGASLAQCLAEELRQPILLVDACRKASDLTQLAGATGMPGLSDYLADPHLAIDRLVLGTKQDNVWLLPAGSHIPPQRTNGAPRTTDIAGIRVLLNDTAQKYDFVVVSGGSVLLDSLPLTIAPHVGCVLLMAIENQTRLDDLDLAQQSLAFCRPRKIGLLLTLPTRTDRRAV